MWNLVEGAYMTRRGFRQMMVAGFVLLCAAIFAAPAAADTVSGKITNSAGGAGISGVNVQLLTSSNGFTFQAFQSPPSAADGSYTITGVTAGSYFIKTLNFSLFIDQIVGSSGNVNCVGCSVTTTGALVAVAGTKTVDFALSPGGAITGTVRAAGTGLGNVTVSIFTAAGTQVGSTSTISTPGPLLGAYGPSAGLTPGQYFVKASNATGFIDQVYQGKDCPFSCTVTTVGGTLVTVTGTAQTNNIDFALNAGGTITGTVTRSDTNAALGNISVIFYDSTGISIGGTQTSNQTATLGQFTSSGLPTGSYFMAVTNNNLGLINQLFSGIPCPGCFPSATFIQTGTPIAVTSPNATTGKNFVLNPGATISGTVTNADGSVKLQNVSVQLVDSSNTFINSRSTDVFGSFNFTGVAANTASNPYFVKTTNASAGGFIDQAFNGKTCVNFCNPSTVGATAIVVASGGTQTGINFALPTGGKISGTVKLDGALTPLSGVTVQAFDAASSFGPSLGSTQTAADGTYTITGLNTGSYTVKTTNSLGNVD
jgi:hypothetical protein